MGQETGSVVARLTTPLGFGVWNTQALRYRRHPILPPQFRNRPAGLQEGLPFLGTERRGRWRPLQLWSKSRCRFLQFSQRRLPASLQFGRHQAIVRVGLVELSLSQPSLVAQSVELLLLSPLHSFVILLESSDRLVVQVQFQRRQHSEKSLDDLGVDGVRRQVLADRNLILLAEVIAEVASLVFVLHDHLVPTGAAIDDAVQ